MSYCVICTHRDGDATRVVGPFDSQEDAVSWAVLMRGGNRAWNYSPDVLMEPPRVSLRDTPSRGRNEA